MNCPFEKSSEFIYWTDFQGDQHRAYVGMQDEWDSRQALIMQMLKDLGLKPSSRVLDLGCGPLMIGQALIPFLDKGGYHGIDPNVDLVSRGMTQETDPDVFLSKAPNLDYNDRFDMLVFGDQQPLFDFIISHNIIPHASWEHVKKIFVQLDEVLAPKGQFLFNIFTSGGSQRGIHATEWTYPGVVQHDPADFTPLLPRGFDLTILEGYTTTNQIPWLRVQRVREMELKPAGRDLIPNRGGGKKKGSMY